jgi:hypothetical protein
LFIYLYQLPLAPPPPEEPPPKPPKLPPEEPLLQLPPPLLILDDLVFFGMVTVFLSWKLQYLQVLSTTLLPDLV